MKQPETVDAAGDVRLIVDRTRLRILESALAAPEGRVLVGRLAEQLGLRQPTVSHHVRLLRDAGLLRREPEGRRAWYSVEPARREEIARLVEASGVELAAPAGDDERLLKRIVDDLTTRYRGVLSPETVSRYVEESRALLIEAGGTGSARPSRAARFAAERLDALVEVGKAALAPQGAAPGIHTPEVLFVCVRNAGRSQLAAALLRHLAGSRVHVRTAGSAPAGEIQRSVAASLEEIGVPMEAEFPKPLNDEFVRAADVVVTMGCGDACPVYPGKRYLDWDVADPDGQPIERVREIRDDVDARIRSLMDELAA